MVLKVNLRPRQAFACAGCGYETVSMPRHCPMCGNEFNEILVTLSDGTQLPKIGVCSVVPPRRRAINTLDTLDWT